MKEAIVKNGIMPNEYDNPHQICKFYLYESECQFDEYKFSRWNMNEIQEPEQCWQIFIDAKITDDRV